MLAIEITFPSKESFVICTCCRVGTLGQPHHDTLIGYLRSITSKRNPPRIYLIGDLNLPQADWSSYSSNIPLEQSFIDSFNSLSLSQLINRPTHKSGNTFDTLLSNSETSVNDVKVLDPHSLCRSDHFPVSFPLKHLSLARKLPNAQFTTLGKQIGLKSIVISVLLTGLFLDLFILTLLGKFSRNARLISMINTFRK
jgi:hypothetical protein